MLPFLEIILVLAVVIALAKAGGYLSFQLGQPAVVGEVLAGLILGPSLINFLGWDIFTDAHLAESITHFAELGVLMLLFIAGLDLHLSDLAETGKIAITAGGLGFFLTFVMGFGLAQYFDFAAAEAIFIGLILAPTSIGISAQTLMELEVLRTRVGASLLGAAVVDDTLGVLGVSIYLAFFLGSGEEAGLASIFSIVLKMVLYLAAASLVGVMFLPKIAKRINDLPISQGLIAFAFSVALFYAWSAEALGQMSTIIGAFMAGLFLARSSLKDKMQRGLSPIAYGVFVPIFFVNIGLSSNVRLISSEGLLLLAGMVVVVILSKVLGALISGRIGGLNSRESLQLGFGMVPRGEVVLIVATIGITEGLINSSAFSTIVVLVIVTTIMTPPILRSLFANRKLNDEE